MIENIKKLNDHNGKWWASLYFHEVPLNKLFVEIKPYEKGKNPDSRKEDTMIFYACVKGEKGYESYHVTITPEFRDWINQNTLYDCGLYLEIIQQQTHNPKEYLDRWLVLLGYDQILGSRWLDYKTTEEIREVFKGDS